MVADDAENELDAARSSEADHESTAEQDSPGSFDPTATSALESGLQNLDSAAEALEDD